MKLLLITWVSKLATSDRYFEGTFKNAIVIRFVDKF